MELEPFPYNIVITKTLNLSNKKYILAYMDQYAPRNNYQMLYVTKRFILYNTAELIVVNLYISEARAIFLLLCDHQDTELE